METGIRDLKDNLSQYIRMVEGGERVVVKSHGRVVAELVRPAAGSAGKRNAFDEMIASGMVTAPCEEGDPLEDLPEIGLSAGSAAGLIDADRDEA